MDQQKPTAERLKSFEEPQPLSEILPRSRFATIPTWTVEQLAAREAKIAATEAQRIAWRIEDGKRRLANEMGARYATCSLVNYALRFVEQKNAVETIKEFLAGIEDHVKVGRGLILYGTVGTGKDHLLSAVLSAAIEAGFGVSWKNAQAIFEAARDQMDKGGQESELMKRFTDPQILGLSDPTPPAGDLTGFRVELLWRIADVRYRNMKPIWLTMNANSIEECQAKLSVPLWDRLQDNAVCVPCFWPSFRVKPR